MIYIPSISIFFYLSFLGLRKKQSEQFATINKTIDTLVEEGKGIYGDDVAENIRTDLKDVFRKRISEAEFELGEAKKVVPTAEEGIEKITKEAGVLPSKDLGAQVGSEIRKSVEAKLAPAEKIYKEVQKKLPFVKVDTTDMISQIDTLMNRFRGDEATTSFLQGRKEFLESSVKNANDLKTFRTDLYKFIGPESKGSQRQAVNELYNSATKLRTDSILETARKSSSPEEFAKIADDIKEADRITRSVAKEIEGTFRTGLQFGKRPSKSGLKEIVRKEVVAPEEATVIGKVFKTKSPESLRQFKKLSPKAFETSKRATIRDIMDKSIANTGDVDPRKLVKEIKSLPLSTQKLIFGDAAVKQVNLLDRFIKSKADQDISVLTKEVQGFLTKTNILRRAKESLPEKEYKQVLGKIRKAEKMLQETTTDVETIFKTGKYMGKSSKAALEDVLEKETARGKRGELLKKIFDPTKPEGIERLQKLSPKSFEDARKAALNEIAEKAKDKGYYSLKKFTNQIKNWPKKTKELVFGKDSQEKLEALIIFSDHTRDLHNVSKTSHLESFKNIFNLWEHLKTYSKAELLNRMVGRLNREARAEFIKDLTRAGIKWRALGEITQRGLREVEPIKRKLKELKDRRK